MKKTDKKAKREAAKARQKTTKATPRTQRELAAMLGISPQLLNYHLKSGTAPDLEDVDGWLAFLATSGREGSLPEDLRREIGMARKRLIEAQAARIERENRIAAGEIIEKSEILTGLQEAVGAYLAVLDRHFLNELPPILTGLDEREIRAKCLGAINEAKATIRTSFLRLGGIDETDPQIEAKGRSAVDSDTIARELMMTESLTDQREFLKAWRAKRDAERAAKRAEWCRSRAAQGLAVPDASDAELRAIPGLSRS